MIDRLTFPVAPIAVVKDREMQPMKQDPDATYQEVLKAYETAIKPEFLFMSGMGTAPVSDKLIEIRTDALHLIATDAKKNEKVVDAVRKFLDDFRTDPLIQRLIVQ